MDLAYVAHTESCALLLDEEGVCRWVVPRPHANERMITMAKRCMGARFLASLDPDVDGLLAHEPRVGTHLLFAISIDERSEESRVGSTKATGRVALVRVGPLLRFDTMDSTLGAPANVEDETPIEQPTDVDPCAHSSQQEQHEQATLEEPEESQEQLELDDDITNLFFSRQNDETPVPRQSGFAIRGTASVTPIPVPPPTRRDLNLAAELQSLMEEETCPFSRVVYEWAAGQEDAASTLRLPLPGRGILPRRSSR